jgi:hypothetical protein
MRARERTSGARVDTGAWLAISALRRLVRLELDRPASRALAVLSEQPARVARALARRVDAKLVCRAPASLRPRRIVTSATSAPRQRAARPRARGEVPKRRARAGGHRWCEHGARSVTSLPAKDQAPPSKRARDSPPARVAAARSTPEHPRARSRSRLRSRPRPRLRLRSRAISPSRAPRGRCPRGSLNAGARPAGLILIE